MKRTLSVLVVAALACAAGAALTSAAPRTVHLRGTAYEFNNARHRLGNATIRVAEFPRIKVKTRANGSYDLVVPNRAKVTPYIQAAGFHTIYLQTFTTAGANLANVNFQTPSTVVYKLLAVALKVPLDRAGNPRRCAVVSTFSTKNVRNLTFAQFIAYGAHGVAGATASARPSLPKPIYFNENVVPDTTQRASSKDGGVVWTDVRTGVYTIAGHHPTTRFASFVATCKPGRIVNANPPWGLYELGRSSR